MQDIDLMILGQNPYKYNNYSKLIRLQYSNYPDSVYNPARKQILQSFLREKIFIILTITSKVWNSRQHKILLMK